MIRASAAALCVLFAAVAEAQRFQPELRFETIGSAYQGVAGVALHVPMGRYVRLGIGGTGAAIRRADLVARFTFDPYRQMRWGLSAGSGLSYDMETGQLYLAVHGDLEGPRLLDVTPFVSAGLAGGARFALGMRRGFQSRR